MVTTQLPSKSEYESALNELRKLNDDLFYDDFKKTIESLENSIVQLTANNSNELKKEANNVINKAMTLFAKMDAQQKELQGLLSNFQTGMTMEIKEHLEMGRSQLLVVYQQLENSVNIFSEKTIKLQQDLESNNKKVLDQAIESVETFSKNVADFAQRLSDSDDRNKKYLEQSEAYVELTKKQLTSTEQKIATHISALQTMNQNLDNLHRSYREMFKKHEESIKNNLIIREEALINKVTVQMNDWSTEQSMLNQNWHEQIDSLLRKQNEQNIDMLNSIAKNMTSKEDLEKVEKKSAFKTNILLSIIFIETILIGIKFFI